MEQNAEMPHAAPQIGSILAANRLESQRLHVYKFENFRDEWNRLAAESGFNSLADAYQPQFMANHKSSKDPYNTTYISRLFFSAHLGDNYKRRSKPGSKSEPSEVYLRALCRLYITDFICGGYDLPVVCADIDTEIDSDMSLENNRLKREAESSIFRWTNFRRRIPIKVLEILASILCLLNRSPSCEARIIYDIDPSDE
jgi:hypothetical protein